MVNSKNIKPQPAIELKVLILGDADVGKSSIAEKFVWGCFNNRRPITIGTDVISRTIQSSGKMYKLNLWETAGLERYHALLGPLFYRNTNICIIVYAIDDRASFENLEKWKTAFMAHGNRKGNYFPFIVVGNKADLSKRQVSEYEAREWCEKNCLLHIETSAKTDINIDQVFNMGIVQHMLNRAGWIPHPGDKSPLYSSFWDISKPFKLDVEEKAQDQEVRRIGFQILEHQPKTLRGNPMWF